MVDAAACASLRLDGEANRALQRRLDEAVAKSGGYGGGVLRIESAACGLVFEGAAGQIAHGGAPLAAADAFEVASVTKSFTAAVLLQLAEEGALRLDAPLGELLPPEQTRGLLVIRGHDYGPELTVRELLEHRSGLPDHWTDPPFVRKGVNPFVKAFLADADRDWSPAQVLAFVPRLEPFDVPGKRHHYSDSGYVLAGMVAERVAGKPLHQLFRERLFAPLGLRDTYLSYREAAPAGSREAHRYEQRLDLHGQRRQIADWASGGLVSSTRDLATFALALSGGRTFARRESLATMTAWHATGTKDVEYGLGLFRIRLDAGLGELWGHDGHGNAFMYAWPSRGLVFVGTLNQTRNDWWPLVLAAVERLGTSG